MTKVVSSPARTTNSRDIELHTASFQQEDYSVSNRPEEVEEILLRTTAHYSKKPNVTDFISASGSPGNLGYPIECLEVYNAVEIGLKKRVASDKTGLQYQPLDENFYVLGAIKREKKEVQKTSTDLPALASIYANGHT